MINDTAAPGENERWLFRLDKRRKIEKETNSSETTKLCVRTRSFSRRHVFCLP
jgi:hypothetical protein